MPFMRELASFQLKTPSGDWEPASLIQWGPFLILWAGTPVVYALVYGGGLSLGASPSAVNVELLEEALQGSDKQGGGGDHVQLPGAGFEARGRVWWVAAA